MKRSHMVALSPEEPRRRTLCGRRAPELLTDATGQNPSYCSSSSSSSTRQLFLIGREQLLACVWSVLARLRQRARRLRRHGRGSRQRKLIKSPRHATIDDRTAHGMVADLCWPHGVRLSHGGRRTPIGTKAPATRFRCPRSKTASRPPPASWARSSGAGRSLLPTRAISRNCACRAPPGI